MLGRIATVAGTGLVLGGYYMLRSYPIDLTNPHLGALFGKIDHYQPKYSAMVFKVLLKLQVLGRDERLGRYILGRGFDVHGQLIEQAQAIGFGGIEVGPISLNPTTPDEQQFHLGIKSCLARICSYRSQQDPTSPFEIHLRVVPNGQVLKFVPYLMKQNVVQSIQAYAAIQQTTEMRMFNRVNVEWDNPFVRLQGREEPEVKKLIGQAKVEIEKQMEMAGGKVGPVGLEYGRSRQEEYLGWLDLLAVMQGQRQL